MSLQQGIERFEPTRESLIGSFCALLELARLGLVRLVQEAPEEISIHMRDDLPAPVSEILRDTVFDDEAREGDPETPSVTVDVSDPAATGTQTNASASSAG